MSALKKTKMALKICTHSGSFHADESLAVYMVRMLPKFQGSSLVRSRNPSDWEQADIVIDVGGKYDGEKYFDHHQRGFEEVFSDEFKTKLSSAGLIYKHFGKEIISNFTGLATSDSNVDILYKKLYKEFIEALDANDNGIDNYDKNTEKKFNDKNITLPALVSNLNPSWVKDPTDKDFDECFEMSSKLMGDSFVRLLDGYANSWLPAKTIVAQAFDDRFKVDPSGKIIVLDRFCPWKEHLYAIEKENNAEGSIEFVLFSDSSSKWRISTIPITSASFEFRKGLPEKWRGVRDTELSELCGIPGCIFVHAAGFIGGAETKDAVLEMAKKSL